MKTLRIKKQYFDQINTGSKTLEARVAYPDIKAIKPGQNIQFECSTHRIVKTVKAVRTHDSVLLMLNNEDVTKLIPKMSRQEAERVYDSIYSPNQVKGLGGMVVIELI